MYTATHHRNEPAARAFIDQNGIKVQIVGERNGKEQKYGRAREGCPLAEGMPACEPLLWCPENAPSGQSPERDQYPEEIEK